MAKRIPTEEEIKKFGIIEGVNNIYYVITSFGVLSRVYWINGEPKYHIGEEMQNIPRILTCKLQGQYLRYLEKQLGVDYIQKLEKAGIKVDIQSSKREQGVVEKLEYNTE